MIVSKWRLGNLLKFSSIVAFMVLIINSTAMAALITDTASFGDSGKVPKFSEIVTLDYYDGSETLDSVKFTMSLTVWDGQFYFDNDGSSAAQVDMNLEVGASLASTRVSLPAASTSTTYSTAYTNSVTLQANDGDDRMFNAGGDDYAYLNTGTQTVTFDWDVDASDLADYYGKGTYDITASVSDILIEILGNSGVAIQTIPPLVNGSLTVAYETSAVPLPSTITLLGLGLGGILAARRRNSAR